MLTLTQQIPTLIPVPGERHSFFSAIENIQLSCGTAFRGIFRMLHRVIILSTRSPSKKGDQPDKKRQLFEGGKV